VKVFSIEADTGIMSWACEFRFQNNEIWYKIGKLEREQEGRIKIKIA
jgi:hypothetical protein